MISTDRLKDLLRLYADNAATDEEVREMLSLLRQDTNDQALGSLIGALREETKDDALTTPVDWEAMWTSIHQPALQAPTPVKKMYWWRMAAAVLITLGIASYLWVTYRTVPGSAIVQSVPAQDTPKDIRPGSDKAVLILADGSEITLDSTTQGRLATQGNADIIKATNGQLVYKRTGSADNEVLYNTMKTPRGGQYSLVLPDGSKVWLNAISSIRYPTFFKGDARNVEITGEAYFEVAKDPLHPFKVAVHSASGKERMHVEVLGTHFNINAYSDEPVASTTLLEGSVKLSGLEGSRVIKPGQQAQVTDSGKLTMNQTVNVGEVMAWKDGYFVFRDTELQTIMRQIMRWYDVEVKYEGNTAARYFTAEISRNKTLSGVLKILELSNIHFKLEGRVLTVIS
ncbi:FecR family protein [Paraflavitalea sp. CAU 1676]|uniref:FecR family protein n=1 Tax=Paraflavitalea sp. CAU 1676 TaxID=3032598 RepID=UPI0023DB7E34|nr:FecR family protein [Paraflavitalea sp. CAU 1676]MDF2190327.1 DUF4974 domain-containing protein [Paraflavitalea sp. CAU 1676]